LISYESGARLDEFFIPAEELVYIVEGDEATEDLLSVVRFLLQGVGIGSQELLHLRVLPLQVENEVFYVRKL